MNTGGDNAKNYGSELILASESPFRARILEMAGVEFTAVAHNLDERSAEAPLRDAGTSPAEVAEILAIAKADSVTSEHPGSTVIGCDQTLSLGEDILHKPRDMEEARRRLLLLSGRTHELNSAIALVRNGEVLWSHVSISRITFRHFDPGFVGRHMAEVGKVALTSVGAYQIEGRGIQLVEKLEGDYFSIVGLPLLPLLAKLRELRLIDR